jgi:cation diffusion facilitator CzcD-associated flavoprotein CzcO
MAISTTSQHAADQDPAPSGGEGDGTPASHFRVAIVGSGFGGIGMAIRLKQAGIEDFAVFERADDVGGTWQANTYPGCQCDVPSHLYSFSFALNPQWSRTFSLQPEIWDYLRGVARAHDVYPHVRLEHEVQSASWDEQQSRWRLSTSQGEFTADIVVAAMGGLSEPSIPDIPGLDSFQGRCFHTAAWDHTHNLTAKRVAVVGTGASTIQVVPAIQPVVEQLVLFQRTPPWVMPHRDRAISRWERRLYSAFPGLQRAMRTAIYWAREVFVLPFLHPRLARNPERIARRHISQQVPDRELRRKVTPRYRFGCKRVLLSNDYYPALSQPNVEVVTDGIAEVRPHSIVTTGGEEHAVDTIIFGTGFQVTSPPATQRLWGREGRLLADVWQGSPRAHLGTAIAGFPNLFMLLGPNTGLGHNSVVHMVESQIAYVMDCLAKMDEHDLASVEVRPEAERAFVDEMQRRMQGTVWMTGGCASWYLDATGRNSTLWPGPSWSYRLRTRRFDPDNYRVTARVAAGEPVAA